MYFIRQGSMFIPSTNPCFEKVTDLPAGNYVLKFKKEVESFYFEQIESFTQPEKVYGDLPHLVQRILKTYVKRDQSTGVALTGEKGSGKTLLAKLLSLEAGKSGMPTILINEPHFGDKFNQFIQAIIQPMVVLFDEFDKVYNAEAQPSLLTLLDGVFPTKKLFLLTLNDRYLLNPNLNNRPSRIFYSLAFRGVSPETVDGYCDEVLEDKKYLHEVKRVAKIYENFNFDMLQSLVEEVNRFDESPMNCLKYLNIRPDFSNSGYYDVVLTVNGKEPENYTKMVHYSPLSNSPFSVYNTANDKKPTEYVFHTNNIVDADGIKRQYVYECNVESPKGKMNEVKVVLTSQFKGDFGLAAQEKLLNESD